MGMIDLSLIDYNDNAMYNVVKYIQKDVNNIGCWLWIGKKTKRGYGKFSFAIPRYHTVMIHRWLYLKLKGSLPNDLVLDHFLYPHDGCVGPSCVNPDHLIPVTNKENSLRSDISPTAINSKKTHCQNGHEFVEDNIYRRPSYPNRRECLTCRNFKLSQDKMKRSIRNGSNSV